LSPSLNNTWINLVYTSDGTTFAGYLNGAQVFATPMSLGLAATGGLSIGGARNGAATFPGLIDDVAILNGALSGLHVPALPSVPGIDPGCAHAGRRNRIPPPAQTPHARVGAGERLGDRRG